MDVTSLLIVSEMYGMQSKTTPRTLRAPVPAIAETTIVESPGDIFS
jgi:hypothetical protein